MEGPYEWPLSAIQVSFCLIFSYLLVKLNSQFDDDTQYHVFAQPRGTNPVELQGYLEDVSIYVYPQGYKLIH
jgi:hypothetical protein